MGEQNVTFMMAILYSKFFVPNCIYNRLASAVEYVDIRLQDGDSTMRIFAGNSANQNIQRTSMEILMRS